jgi:uncharacterized membrane protein YsdA (DUF1294 family)
MNDHVRLIAGSTAGLACAWLAMYLARHAVKPIRFGVGLSIALLVSGLVVWALGRRNGF